MITPETVKMYEAINAQLQTAANDLIIKYIDLYKSILGTNAHEFEPNRYTYPLFNGLRMESIDSVNIYYGGDEYHSLTLPTRYLWEDWIPEVTKELNGKLDTVRLRKEAEVTLIKFGQVLIFFNLVIMSVFFTIGYKDSFHGAAQWFGVVLGLCSLVWGRYKELKKDL